MRQFGNLRAIKPPPIYVDSFIEPWSASWALAGNDVSIMHRYIKSAVAVCVLAVLPAWGASPWTFTPSLTVKEGYDDNIYLQSQGELADHDSLVTSVMPSLALSYQGTEGWKPLLELKYAPEASFYHSEHDEDNVTHNIGANFKGRKDGWSFDLANTVTAIDGSHYSPTFVAPGSIPAMGGIALRDRRDAAILRTNYVLRYDHGDYMLRAVVTTYIHDFQTAQRTTAGYENYVDRAEFNGGVDAGYKFMPDTYAIIGYRFGYQDQSELFDSPLAYSSYYQRILFGVEGKPTSWVKLSLIGGPDFRDFTGTQVDGFDTRQTKIFVDSTATFTLTPDDQVTLLMRQFLQVSFCGRAIYEDITYQASYKHQFTPKASATLLLRSYTGDWQNPSTRNDTIYTAGVSAAYKLSDNVSLEAGYNFELAESNIPDTDAREYQRNTMFVGARYAF